MFLITRVGKKIRDVLTNPEEINRICTDHVSTKLLACTQSSMDELENEGLKSRSFLVGDPMYDAFMEYSNRVDISEIELELLGGGRERVPSSFYYLTCHREENTVREDALVEIFKAMNALDSPTVYPVHPRNKERALRLKRENGFDNIILSEPVGYLESTSLVRHAKKIVTDSGGLQREAFFAGKKCVTVLDFVVWPETMVDNRNVLSKPVASEIIKKIQEEQFINEEYQPFGDGHAADKIVGLLEK